MNRDRLAGGEMTALFLTVRLTLAALLALGAVLKAPSLRRSAQLQRTALSALVPTRAVQPLWIGATLAEGSLAVILLLPASGAVGDWLVLVAMLCSSAYLLLARRTVRERSCGCFGSISSNQISGWACTRGLLLVAMASILVVAHSRLAHNYSGLVGRPLIPVAAGVLTALLLAPEWYPHLYQRVLEGLLYDLRQRWAIHIAQRPASVGTALRRSGAYSSMRKFLTAEHQGPLEVWAARDCVFAAFPAAVNGTSATAVFYLSYPLLFTRPARVAGAIVTDSRAVIQTSGAGL